MMLATPRFLTLTFSLAPPRAPIPTCGVRADDWDATLDCLRAFVEVSGEALPRHSFVVPSHEPYPPGRWGDRLGARYTRLQRIAHQGKLSKGRRVALEAIGIDLRTADERGFDLMMQALEAYLAQHGDITVPMSFVVPHDDLSWPGACWGLRLGNRVNAVRTKGRYLKGKEWPERTARLESLGFVWAVPSLRFEVLVDALRAFREEHGHLQVPQSFQVPACEPWPRRCWRLPLGARVAAVRNQGQYVSHANLGAERREQLEQLGFEWRMLPRTAVRRHPSNGVTQVLRGWEMNRQRRECSEELWDIDTRTDMHA